MKLLMTARILLLLVFTISLISISIFCVLTRNLKDVPSMMGFLKQANTFSHIADIARFEIRSYYPPVVANNFILRGVTDQAIDRIITPSLIEYGAAPALKLAYGFAKSPSSIINNKVVVDTNPYKTQAKQAIAEIGLPQIVVINADFLVDNLPPSLTLVDLEKNPNSVLGSIIKLRTFYENSQRWLSFSYVVLILSTFFMIALNLHRLKFMTNEFFIGTLVSGATILVATFVLPGIITMNLPTGGGVIQAQNMLILDAMQVLLSKIRFIAYVYLGISLFLFLIIWFLPFEKLQKKFDRMLKRVHVPQVTVRVK